jgi:ethanolamine ammonia-lyase small subunit
MSAARDRETGVIRAPRGLDGLRERTPARVLVGRAGVSYPTATQLELREDHAIALDAVRAPLDLHAALGIDVVERFALFEVRTCATSKEEHLLRPDLGRRFSGEARREIARRCRRGADLQVALADGLSAAAVAANGAAVLLALEREAAARGLSLGDAFAIRHGRVGLLNEIGELLDAEVCVLLIGERPGLATAESLSAYLAYRPRPGHSDAQRNLISNIHARGVSPEDAARRIVALALQMRRQGTSGVAVKEEFIATPPGAAQ